MKTQVNPMINNISIDNIKKLNTGDIVMCHGSKIGDSPIDKAIEYATHSPWVHTGIIIRDPFGPDCKIQLKGLYILQSGAGPNGYPDVIDGITQGVTLNRLDEFLQNRVKIYIMTLNNVLWDDKNKKKFYEIFKTVHGKPYDKKWCHWCIVGISSFLRCECFARKIIPREKYEYWCSALVAYIYCNMGWIDDNDDWTCDTPSDIIKWQLINGKYLSQPWLLKP